MVWVAPQGSATMIKSSPPRTNPSSGSQNLKYLNKEFQTSTPKCKRQLRSFARTQHKGGKFSSRTHPQGAKPQKRSCGEMHFYPMLICRCGVLPPTFVQLTGCSYLLFCVIYPHLQDRATELHRPIQRTKKTCLVDFAATVVVFVLFSH